jgi:putative transposase
VEDGVRSFSHLEFARGVGACRDGDDGHAATKTGKAASPSYGLIDSQSVKPQYASEERGIDGDKKVKGRQRHIVVETLGNLLHVQGHAANQADTIAGCEVLERTAQKYPSLEAFCGDPGYRGTAVTFVHKQLDLVLHIVPRLGEGFVVQPKRWVVERTFAGLGHFRRLAKEGEILTGTAENMIRIAMLKTTLAKC